MSDTTAVPSPAPTAAAVPPAAVVRVAPVHPSLWAQYASAILSLLVLVAGAVSVTLSGVITPVGIIQVVTLAIGGILTFVVPLVKGPWAGALKSGIPILLAAIALVVPYVVAGHITTSQILLVVVGGIQAAASQLGVAIRITDQKQVALAA